MFSGVGYLIGALSSKGDAEVGAATPMLAQMFGNFDVNVPLGTPLLCVDFGQQTDFYFFYDVSRVCTASYGGVMLNLFPAHIPLQAVASYHIPWYRGYMTTRENYFSARINLVF